MATRAGGPAFGPTLRPALNHSDLTAAIIRAYGCLPRSRFPMSVSLPTLTILIRRPWIDRPCLRNERGGLRAPVPFLV